MSACLACGPQTPGDTTEGTSASTGPEGTTAAPEPTGSSTAGDATDASTGDASTGDASTGDASTGDATTGEPVCLDFFSDNFDPQPPTPPMFTCGLPELCPGAKPLIFSLSGFGIDSLDDPEVTAELDDDADVERARCMITALRDRQTGHFNYVGQPGQLGDNAVRDEIVGELVARQRISSEDFYFEWAEAVQPLREPAFFAACLADGSATALWHCLYGSRADECVLSPLACP